MLSACSFFCLLLRTLPNISLAVASHLCKKPFETKGERSCEQGLLLQWWLRQRASSYHLCRRLRTGDLSPQEELGQVPVLRHQPLLPRLGRLALPCHGPDVVTPVWTRPSTRGGSLRRRGVSRFGNRKAPARRLRRRQARSSTTMGRDGWAACSGTAGNRLDAWRSPGRAGPGPFLNRWSRTTPVAGSSSTRYWAIELCGSVHAGVHRHRHQQALECIPPVR